MAYCNGGPAGAPAPAMTQSPRSCRKQRQPRTAKFDWRDPASIQSRTRDRKLTPTILKPLKGCDPMSVAENYSKEISSKMSDAEWKQRVDLAACYRLIAHYGWDDLVDTHISARVPGPARRFLINPYGLMFVEITATSLVKVDLDGNQLSESEYSINPAGFTIHSAIHEVREDAGCL